MDIKVALPKPNDTSGVDIKKFLRQMELCVHYLKKSVEELEKQGEDMEEYFLMYRFPRMKLDSRKSDGEGRVLVHIDEENDQMMDIEIQICSV